MSEDFYSHARLYDLMFPGGGPAAGFYRAAADRQGGRVLELGCGTGNKLIPIASAPLPLPLPLLVSLGGLRLVERLGDFAGRPLTADSPLQLCICEAA